MQLNLYSVSDEYVDYLRKFDNKVYDNKEEVRAHTRKYLGVVLNKNSFNNYIPFSSPKETDYYDNTHNRIRKSIIPIVRIVEKGKLYGTLRTNNFM